MITKRIQQLEESATLAVDAKAKEMKANGIDVVSFGAGQPDFPTPQNIKEEAISAINGNFTGYTESSGIPELKKAIAAKFRRENGLEYDASQIIVSCGAKHTLHNIMETIVGPGDEVLIPVPYWVSYAEQVKLAGGTPVFCATDEKAKIRAGMIAEKVTDGTKALILSSPSNPTGMVCDADELKKIADLAATQDFYVIADEIYEHLIYGGNRHISIASLGDGIKNRAITVNGVSKSYSMTGWRIGYCGAPKDIAAGMAKLQSQTTSNPTSISQKAAIEALNGPQESVAMMRQEFDRRRMLMHRLLNGMEGVRCHLPEGAFYCWANISETGLSSMDFASRLLEEAHVAVVPGIAFGDDNFIRLSYACSTEQIEKGMERMKKWVQQR
ncbi:TPA: pyridoxal phosphate-dependent aminotransferase [Candidatus Woesearchaeota archaeon]|nr:pyridoxal phosphate-dependent aminotransferase [Candidatus Woesearchaeota archaeon]HIH91336.1 pyridoxal phosphate-dependent aminotransferase [Candidatus Woesearchaeota archaeon]HII64033.1 pyridoxal phosphate-dependent aminotransferase [Candidatus Woesearchaeota archaeon]